LNVYSDIPKEKTFFVEIGGESFQTARQSSPLASRISANLIMGSCKIGWIFEHMAERLLVNVLSPKV
jgi:hypothetical protein